MIVYQKTVLLHRVSIRRKIHFDILMNRPIYYEVILKLDDGDEITSLCQSTDPKRALSIVLSAENLVAKLKGRKMIDFDVREATWVRYIRETRFLVQESMDHDHWIVTDKEYNVVYKILKNNESLYKRVSLLSFLDEEPDKKEKNRLFQHLLVWISKFRPDLGRGDAQK